MRLFTRSIRLRLLAFAALGTVIAIAIAGWGLTELFGRHVERRLGQELDTHIAQLAAALRVEPGGRLILRGEPSDPRFQRPLAGLYWQIRDETNGALQRSRSLWDAELAAPPMSVPTGAVESRKGVTPEGHTSLVHERRVVLAAPDKSERPVRITVAVDEADLATLRTGFARDLLPGLVLLALLIILAAWAQVRLGLTPFARLRDALGAVRSGAEKRLALEGPSEVAPLVEELNKLLAAQEAEMTRARDRAADLAHGLRTPLTALASDVARLRSAGQHEVANDIEAVSQQMRRTVERELARARLRHQSADIPATAVAPIVDAVARTLGRTPRGDMIAITHDVPPQASIFMGAEDLAEVLGNVMENAVRAAKAQVRVTQTRHGDCLCIHIDDDGPGFGPGDAERLLQRGQRRDESGSAGLGLAIVGDILAAYGADMRLERSDLGGARVTLRCPGTAKA